MFVFPMFNVCGSVICGFNVQCLHLICQVHAIGENGGMRPARADLIQLIGAGKFWGRQLFQGGMNAILSANIREQYNNDFKTCGCHSYGTKTLQP